MFSDKTVYISAFAKLPLDMPSAHVYKSLDIGLIINFETHIVEGMSVTLITEDTKRFLKHLVVGRSLENGIDLLLDEIKLRYHGNSQKAVCVALRLIYEKYIKWQEEYLPQLSK